MGDSNFKALHIEASFILDGFLYGSMWAHL